MKRVLIALPYLSDEHKAKLNAAGAGCDIKYVPDSEVTRADVEDAEIIIGNLSMDVLSAAKRLELLQVGSSGADMYMGKLSEGTVLATSTGAYSQAVAEHALAATLMLQKKFNLYRDAQKRHEWADFGTIGSINGATVLVMGLGEIGRYYARMVKALGAYVLGIKRHATDKPEYVDELYVTEQFDEVCPRADVIVSVLPGSPENAHFYTYERFKAMKNGCIFINCGRGNAVAADVIERALEEGEIAAAALDVFETEPLPADSPLWDMDNLFITPHAAGYFHLPATLDRVVDICAYNLHAYLNGGELKNVKAGAKK